MEQGIFEIVDTDSLVPAEHLLCKSDEATDFNNSYDPCAVLASSYVRQNEFSQISLFYSKKTSFKYVVTTPRRSCPN